MRLAVAIISVAVGIGIGLVLPMVAPYFPHDVFGGMGITMGSSTHEIEISETTILWVLRGLGICIALAGILYALSPKHDSDA